ncbi:MAG: cytochrome b [Oleiphilaceae bacterium]|nr:cytochrome b [Oleiphilaceae bacterium]
MQVSGKSSAQVWHPALIIIHWLSVVVILGLYAVGWYMVQLDYYDSWYRVAPMWHKAFGLLWAFVIILRLVLRLILPRPPHLSTHRRWERFLASTLHLVFYGLLFFLFATGYIISTADGRAIDLFDVIEIPALFSANQLEAWLEYPEDVAGEWHALAADLLVILVAVHAAGALKHHFIDRDSTLMRMLGVSKNES